MDERRPASPHLHSRHRKHGTARARVWIVLVFLGLAATYAVLVWKTPQFIFNRRMMVPAFILMNLWNFTLLLGVWTRQGWARYLTVGLWLLLSAVVGVITPNIIAHFPPMMKLLVIEAGLFGGAHIVATTVLLASPDVKRLMTRALD